MTKRLREKWRFVRKFMSSDVWDIELSSLTALRRLGVKSARVLHLVFKGFKEDNCPLHASALTFNTLMAIVPILALSLALARVFGGAALAEDRLRGVVSDFTSQFGTQEVRPADPDSIQVKPDTQLNGSAKDVMAPEELAEKLNQMLDQGFKQVNDINFSCAAGRK